MQEEADSDFVHREGFGKGQGFASEAAQALAQRVVETLDVIRGAFGGGGSTLGGGQDVVVAFPMIGVQPALTVSGWDAAPQEARRGVIARAERVGHDLAGSSTQSQPTPQPNHPTPTRAHKAPQAIDLQDILGLSRQQGGPRPPSFWLTRWPLYSAHGNLSWGSTAESSNVALVNWPLYYRLELNPVERLWGKRSAPR